MVEAIKMKKCNHVLFIHLIGSFKWFLRHWPLPNIEGIILLCCSMCIHTLFWCIVIWSFQWYGYVFMMLSLSFHVAVWALRFVGHPEWFRTDQRGRFSWDFLSHKDTPLEEVDMSHTVINYTGLENLGKDLLNSIFSYFKLTNQCIYSLPVRHA